MGVYIKGMEMPRDIEPGLVIEFADGIDGKRYARLWHYRHGGLTEWLEAVSTADVRPVVKGTWVGIDDFPHEDWECDHCGCVVGNTDDPWNYYHFCPNCGADMRKEV